MRVKFFKCLGAMKLLLVELRKFYLPPGLTNVVRFEDEHKSRDPKDGELYLSRTKPGETLVEVRRGTDVQIVRPTWV